MPQISRIFESPGSDLMTEEFSLCECGCGKPVAKKGNRFILGHNSRSNNHPMFGKEHSLESREKQRLSSRKRWDDPKEREKASLGQIERFSDPTERKAQSIREIQYHIDHPEAKEIARLRSIGIWSSQEARDAQSIKITNSESAKVEHERQRGGNDILNHHYIYDHANPEKYTMKVTRKKHTQIHRWMRKAGIVVPHINKDIPWRYKK